MSKLKTVLNEQPQAKQQRRTEITRLTRELQPKCKLTEIWNCTGQTLTDPIQIATELHCFARQYPLRWFVFHICHTHFWIAFPCLYSVILSPNAVYGVSCPFSRPKMFSPGDRLWYHSTTLGAHVLPTVVCRSPNEPQFCHIRYIRPVGVTQVDHESTQLSRLEAVAVASRKSPESPDMWGMCLMENGISLVICVRCYRHFPDFPGAGARGAR